MDWAVRTAELALQDKVEKHAVANVNVDQRKLNRLPLS
jgi:hypothetical protein